MTEEWNGKTIVILGLARQGAALARFAAQEGATVVVSDLRSADQLRESMDALADLNVQFVLGEHPLELLDNADMLAVSGGVPLTSPFVRAAVEKGILLSNDSHEFIKRCPAPVIGITGSAGKTTTTALVGAMAQAAGRRTWVGGNIGRPLIADLAQIQPDDLVVQELSSFQLELWRQSPAVAAVLNVTPNHLDRHASFEAYSAAKANILRYQTDDDVAVLAADDPGAQALAPLVQGRLRQFSINHDVPDGSFVRDDMVIVRRASGDEVAVIPVNEIRLRGRHNLLNVCAAVTLADTVDLPTTGIADAIADFTGVAHRLELVATIEEVSYVNDSIATAPERALAALSSFGEPLILLAGGQDKNMVWDNWAQIVAQQVKHVVLFGALAEMLQELLERARVDQESSLQISRVPDLEAAVQVASAVSAPGDVVLLSPGGTSYDAYDDFAARGRHFRSLVEGAGHGKMVRHYDDR